MRNNESQFQLYLDTRLKDDFKKACTLQGETMAIVVRRFMANYTNKVFQEKLKASDTYYVID
jgi:hypothetical protein